MFIVIEGMDGSGKSTLSKSLSKLLKSEQKTVEILREPGGNITAESIRNLIFKHGEINTLTETLLFIASRSAILPKLNELTKKKSFVILDRFYMSTLVYQGIAKSLGYDKTKALNKIIFQNYPNLYKPDLTIFMDIDYKISKNRRISDSKNRFDNESLNFYKTISEGYRFAYNDLSKEMNFLKIDASLSPEKILDIVFKKIKEIYAETKNK